MKTIHLFSGLAALTFVCFSSANAQIGSIPERGFGPRGLALGQSVMISFHDALSGSWNPASVVGLEKITVTAYRSALLMATVNSNYGLAVPTRKFGTFGISLFHIGVGGITIIENGQRIGEATFRQDHLLLTYGKRLTQTLSFGFNMKFLEQSFWRLRATPENPGIDLGLHYRFRSSLSIVNNLAVGVAIDNFVKPGLKLMRVTEYLPRETRMIAERKFEMADGKLTFVSNLAFREKLANKVHLGVEYVHKSALALRAGYHEQISVGAGLKLKGFIVDYAYFNWADASTGIPHRHAMALTYQF